jgi:protein-S-isoprenylcysteine O-methyltransferase Ste14
MLPECGTIILEVQGGHHIVTTTFRKIAVDCGRSLFKMRSYTPVPIIAVMLFCFRWEWEKPMLTWSCGLLLLICGEALRFWSLRYMGKFSRTRKKKARMLVTAGPYAFVRNPLYWGNLLILEGFTVMSDLMWLVPIVLILFFVQYQCIVLWEEECLREFFPAAAESYFRSVPRWLPKWGELRNRAQHFKLPYYDWSDVVKRERSTLQGLVMGCLAMVVKEFLS